VLPFALCFAICARRDLVRLTKPPKRVWLPAISNQEQQALSRSAAVKKAVKRALERAFKKGKRKGRKMPCVRYVGR
jgi:hypothetical protein